MKVLLLDKKSMEVLASGGWLMAYGKILRLSPEGFLQEWVDGVWGPIT